VKIAIIAAEYWPFIDGGAGNSITLLVDQLRKRGLFVDVYVFNKKLDTVYCDNGFAKYYPLVNRNFHPITNIYAVFMLLKKLGQYDLIHVYSPVLMTAVGFLKKILKVPAVATLNGIDATCIYYKRWISCKCSSCLPSDALYCSLQRSYEIKNMVIPFPILFLTFLIQRHFAKGLNKYFALSTIMKEIYISGGFSPSKFAIIPNMYDPIFLKKLNAYKYQKSDEKIIILYAGRLTEEKGVVDLLQAFLKLKTNKAKLWIVGRGPETGKLRSIIDGCNASNVEMIPFVSPPDMYKIYKKAHIFVHPGKWPEPFSRTLLEAMLAKLAIIASDSGSSYEVLGGTGMIYETGNITQLAQNMQFLINNLDECKKLGLKAYTRVLNDFSPDKIIPQIIDNYITLTRESTKFGKN